MALEAMETLEIGQTPTLQTTQSLTLAPTTDSETLSFHQHCTLAWTILQDALPKAQAEAFGSAEIVADIRLGLSLVAQDCPNYRGATPTLNFTPTFSPTLEDQMIATKEVSMSDGG
jgi:hypothetical protein